MNRDKFSTAISYLLYILCALVLLIDIVHHRHAYFSFEQWFGFYALIGFFSIVITVFCSQQLRNILKRDEDYYD